MYTHFGSIFVKHQCGFRNAYDAQHYLLVINEKVKEARDGRQLSY